MGPSWAGLPWRAVRIPAVPPSRQRTYQRLAVCDAQLAGDLGPGLALGEQVGGLQPAAFQPLQVSRVSEHPTLGSDSCSTHAAEHNPIAFTNYREPL